MSSWDDYPPDYRQSEVQQIVRAACAGECAAIVGLSGSGKSNLVGFLAHRVDLPEDCARFALVDCNRLTAPGIGEFYRLLLKALAGASTSQASLGSSARQPADTLEALEAALAARLHDGTGVCFLLDRFDALYSLELFAAIANSLRALRDAFKYQLTYVIAARRPIPHDNELAELFFRRTVWLGPLALSDALWSARRDAARFSPSVYGASTASRERAELSAQESASTEAGERAEVSPQVGASGKGQDWSQEVLERLVSLSGGYPALLRAACEAYADGTPLDSNALRQHPAVQQRLAEFWADAPGDEALQKSGLGGIPWIAGSGQKSAPAPVFDPAQLTAKENRLLEYFHSHANEVCDKDDLVRAVWPEDVIYTQGIRDESLAQLIRRLRVKIELDPGAPQHIHTVPGRGYLFKP